MNIEDLPPLPCRAWTIWDNQPMEVTITNRVGQVIVAHWPTGKFHQAVPDFYELDRAAIEKRIGNDLRESVEDARKQIDELHAQIAEWQSHPLYPKE